MSGWSAGSKAHSWERDLSLLARGRTWPKWSAFLNANQDFWILTVIAWVDAYNLQTGSNFLQELCFLFRKGTAQWQVHWVSNICYYTFLWPENQFCLCLHPYSACIRWTTQPCAVWGWQLFILFYSSVGQDFPCAWSYGSKQSLPHLSSVQRALVSPVQLKLWKTQHIFAFKNNLSSI